MKEIIESNWKYSLSTGRFVGANCDVYIDFDWESQVGHRQRTLSGLNELTSVIKQIGETEGVKTVLLFTVNIEHQYDELDIDNLKVIVVNINDFINFTSKPGRTGLFFVILCRKLLTGDKNIRARLLLNQLGAILESNDIDLTEFVDQYGASSTASVLAGLIGALDSAEDKSAIDLFIHNLSSETNQTLIQLATIKSRSFCINTFENMLRNTVLSETPWQNFFDENRWLLGNSDQLEYFDVFVKEGSVKPPDYSGKGARRVDFFAKTLGTIPVIRLIEIKRPNTKLMHETPYRGEIFKPSDELSGAIVQILSYCSDVQHHSASLNLPGETIKPHGVLVIGQLSQVNQSTGMRKSFEELRASLHGISIVCFDELLNRGKAMNAELTIMAGASTT